MSDVCSEMDGISGSVGNFNNVTSASLRIPPCDSADPFKPVHTRDIVTDARVSSIMTLALRTALSYTAGLYADNAIL
jgi:hypothetical protein